MNKLIALAGRGWSLVIVCALAMALMSAVGVVAQFLWPVSIGFAVAWTLCGCGLALWFTGILFDQCLPDALAEHESEFNAAQAELDARWAALHERLSHSVIIDTRFAVPDLTAKDEETKH